MFVLLCLPIDHFIECSQNFCHFNIMAGIVEVEGRETRYREATTIHEKYASRPPALENMCLTQFNANYDMVTGKKKYNFDPHGAAGYSDTRRIISWRTEEEEAYLPIIIKLGNNMGLMQLRTKPAVIRFHQYHHEKDPHRFIYTELLFFRPWRSEEELGYDNFEHCLQLYNDMEVAESQEPEDVRRTKLEKVKEKVFPSSADIEKARSILESLPFPEQRPQHIADQLDPENEMDNLEQMDQSDDEDEEYAGREPGEMGASVDERGCISQKGVFQSVSTHRMEDMLRSVRQQDPDQRIPFNIVMKWCKSIRKCEGNPKLRRPCPPLLIVHGGAGCGKSKLVHDMSQWAEHILRTNNNKDPSRPFVVRTAPTGTAAYNIDGLTFHSAFGFPFGNTFNNLGDRQRELMRASLQNLTLLIIDEMSMVKSDLLYQLHLRLCEIKQNTSYFGGVGVVLCGDLMQLRPIKANWIFDEPRGEDFKESHQVQSLWDLFKTVELRHNHRQGSDRKYADLLNRVRVGKMTKADLNLLRSRVTDKFPSNGVYIFGKRKLVRDQNIRELNKLRGEVRTLKAVLGRATRRKPQVDKAGFIKDTPFMDSLEVKNGARVMMTYNCNTADGLTNGAVGTVKGFLNNKGEKAVKDADISYILVEFDVEKIGRDQRDKLKHLTSKCPHKKATPVPRVKFTRSLGKATKQHSAHDSVIQFPLTLAWAMTAHKCQGQTIRAPIPMVADLDSVFAAGQAYVILGRIQSIDQLFLRSFSAKKIMVDVKALEEADRIRVNAINNVVNPWTEQNTFLRKISSLNIRSLRKHLLDLSVDGTLLKSDFICIQETWLMKDHPTPALPGYKGFFCGEGRGKGVAIYVKECHSNAISDVRQFSNEHLQLLKLSMSDFDLITIYRSPSSESNKNMKPFTSTVVNHVTQGKSTLICGDVNIDLNLSPRNEFTKSLRDIGFVQRINLPTHLEGGILDHCYMRSTFEMCWNLHYPYYSDHDALNIILRKNLKPL